MDRPSGSPSLVVGRYALCAELASGGMATVFIGRLRGPVGFSRTVAIKRLHPQYARDPEFVRMFLDEARVATRIRHPNVIPTVDVVAERGQLLLVMEYVQGESLSRLIKAMARSDQLVPPPIAVGIMTGVLHGLHAAHEARSERGEPLGIVHRDVSPQNVVVCVDGLARVLDFGIAKAAGNLHTTRDGSLKGKLSYMAPEQVLGQELTRRTDIYAAAIVLWETLTTRRLFAGDNEGNVVEKILHAPVPRPSEIVKDLPAGLDRIVLRGLARDPSDRYATAEEMALELEDCVHPATPTRVGAWVATVARDALAERTALVAEIEGNSAPPSAGGVKRALAELGPLRETLGDTVRQDGPPVSAAPTKVDPTGGARVEEPQTHTSAPVSAPSQPRTRMAGPRRWGMAGLVAAFVLLAGLFVRMRVERGSAGAPPSALPPPPSPPVVATATAPPPSPTTPPVATTALPPEPAATKRAPRSNAHPSSHATGAVDAAGGTPAPASSTVDCSEPYTRDELGRKIYKLECLHP